MVVHFKAPAAFRRWLDKNHDKATELQVGFFKKETGKPSITWPESVDEALCFGWIDGVRKSLGAESYTIRFTPRKPGSVWSAVNIAKVAALEAAGRMRPAGRAAFEKRKENRTGIYSYEQRPQELPAEYRQALERNRAARSDFDARPPWYRKTAIWKIVSAKTEATRRRRLAQLIECHAKGETIPELRRTPKSS